VLRGAGAKTRATIQKTVKLLIEKIYEDICGQFTLQRVLRGVSDSELVEKIILAMPTYDEAEFVARHNNKEFDYYIDERFTTFFGSSDDLMDRYYNAAIKHDIDTIVRICADSPLIQGELIDEMIEYYNTKQLDGFLGNIKVGKLNYPAGMAIEIFPLWMLQDAMSLTDEPIAREHVTPFMYRTDTTYKIYSYENEAPHTIVDTRFDNFSFDTMEDLVLIKRIVAHYDQHKDINRAIQEA